MPNSKTNKHELRVDRAFAQGDISIATTELIRYIDGKRVVTRKKSNSPNQERLNDALVSYFQAQVKSSFNYYDYREEAMLELEEKFTKHNINNGFLTYNEKKIRAAAIQQIINQKILSKFVDNPRMEIDFDELVRLSNLKAVKSFMDKAILISSILGRSGRHVKQNIVDLETMTIKETIYSERIEIIGIDFVLEPEMAIHFPKIDDFINASMNPLDNKVFRNKKKYVKKVGVIFSKDVIPHILCQGTDFVLLDQKTRQFFKYQNTYAIDTYVTSIQHAQEWRQLTDFTPAGLQKKFGHDYSRFNMYLKKVIDPCVEDFNMHDSRVLSYIIKRKGYEWGDEASLYAKTEIEKFRWVVENYEKSARDDIDSVHYFIALMIFKNEPNLKNQFNSVRDFSLSIASQLESGLPSLTTISGKTVEEWIAIATNEIACEIKIIELFKINNISDVLYDKELMQIVSEKFDLQKVGSPSLSLSYLTDILKVNSPKKKENKSAAFPLEDKDFLLTVINKLIQLGAHSPLHFLFIMDNLYKDKKNQHW